MFFACCDSPRGGAATPTTSGPGELTVTFDPDDEFAGPATFAYTVDDQQGHTVAGAVTIEVLAPSNRPPTATDATLDVEAGIPTNVDLAALASDPDPGDTLSFTTSEPADGAVQLTVDGPAVQATASLDQAGQTDSFQYTVTDSAGQSATATVSLQVVPPSAPPPVAQADSATTNQGAAVGVAVLANDIDPLGQGLTVAAVGASDAGEATTDGQSVTFTPRADFFGTSSFLYRVRDGANGAERESEGQVTVTVIGAPAAPGSPSAVAGNATATVNWAAPASNGAPIDDYELSIGEGATVSVGAATGYTWSGLTNGQPVQFSVRAHNSAGWGPWSGPSAPITPDIEPGRPAAPSAQFADGALLVSWSAPANEGSAITGYDLQIGGGASSIVQVGATTSYRWDGLTNGQEYTFMVRAVNARGAGEWSAPSAPEHPLRPPDAPPAPVGERGDKFIRVAWSPGSNGGDPIIEYQVQLASTGATNTTTGTGLTWSNLPNGQPQQFLVRARNRADWGPWSGASAPVTPCGVPDTPGSVSASRADGAANVSWSAPYDQGCAISGYRIDHSGGGSTSVGGGATSATVGGLTNGQTYTFRVTAINEVGAGAASGASNPVVPAGPPGPTTATGATPDTGRVTVTYAGANPNGSPITTYQLSVNGGGWENIGTSGSTTRGGLANGTNYDFRVRAVNDVGAGVPANSVSARTPGEPAQVGGLDLGTSRHEVRATWAAPNDNGKPITRYEVDIAPGGTVNETDRSHTFTGLQDDTVYDVRVRACNEVGCGAWSATKSIRTPAAPVNVNWRKDGSAVGQPNCSHSSCAWVFTSASGLTPGQTYTVTCHGSVQGAYSIDPAHRRRQRQPHRPLLLLRLPGRDVLDDRRPARVRAPPLGRLINLEEHHGDRAHGHRSASGVVQPLVQRPAREHRARHQGQARPGCAGARVPVLGRPRAPR